MTSRCVVRRALRAALAWLVVASTLLVPLGTTAAPEDPPSELTLESQGFSEVVLRGGTSRFDMYFPGAGRLKVGDGSVFGLVLSYSDTLDPETSTISVSFNGVPMRTWFLRPENSSMREIPIPVPASALRPDVNHVELRFIMRLKGEACTDTEHPSLTATVYRQTWIRYDYVRDQSRMPMDPPNLGRFPLYLLEPSALQPNRMALVVPDDASLLDLQAALTVAAGIGRRTGGRPVTMRLLPPGSATDDLRQGNVVVVGRPAANALWNDPRLGESRELPLSLEDAERGAFAGPDGQLVGETEGVVMDVPSPWNPDFRAVLLTGGSDEAALRAAEAISSDTARRSLHGSAAVITEAPDDPEHPADSTARDTLTDFTLADLGASDRTFTGWGVNVLSTAFDAPGVPARGARAEIFYDHSRVINPNISAVAVTLNDVPLLDTPLKNEAPGRSTLDVPLPAKVLKTGRNVLSVRFNIATPGGSTQMCGSLPSELAWGVLYSDSSIHLPPGTAGGTGLGSFPFPFVREGRATGTLLVLPDDVAEAEQAADFAAEFGRSISSDVLDLRVTTAGRLTPEQRFESNLIVFGYPWANPLVTELGSALPLRLDGQGRVVQSVGRPLAGVRDASVLGVIQTIPSPFNPQRAVLVVTGTAPGGLELALRGLRQGGLRGNLATVSPPDPGSRGVGIRTFDVPLTEKEPPPQVRVQQAVPSVLTVLAAGAAAVLLVGTGVALVLRARRRAARSVGQVVDEWQEWLEALDVEQPAGERK